MKSQSDIKNSILLWHVGLGAILGLLSLLPALFLSIVPSIRKTRITEYVTILTMVVISESISLLDICALIAQKGWNGELNRSVILRFLPEIPSLLNLYGPTAWLAVGSTILAIGYFSFTQARRAAFHERSLEPSIRHLAVAAAILGLTVSAFWIVWCVKIEKKILPDDTIIAAFRDGDIGMIPMTRARIISAKTDDELRATFKSGTPLHKNAVLIIIDALRADHLPMAGYSRNTTPFLMKLFEAKKLAQIPNAYSAGTESLVGIASIVTSRSFLEINQRSFGLVEYMGRNGFETHLLLSGTHDWFGLKKIYGNFITTYKDSEHRDKEIPMHNDKQLVAWARKIPPAGPKPAFIMIHMMSTHNLGVIEEEERFWSRGKGVWPVGYWAQKALGIDYYDDQIRAADKRIREIWEILAQKGYLEDSLVVITADHGQMLGEHGQVGHGPSVWEGAIRIPLFWASSDLSVVGDTKRMAWTCDIAPTFAHFMGLKPLPSWSGKSLFTSYQRDLLVTEQPGKHGYWGSIIKRTDRELWKYHRYVGPDNGKTLERLFDLAKDPFEEKDLFHLANKDLIAELRNTASQVFSEH